MNKRILIITMAIAFVTMSFLTIEKTSYKVDITESSLKWTAYHLGKSYEHWGNVKLKSGSLDITDGKITGGSFVIDMTTITNGDLENKGKNGKLVKDLKSDRFFGAEEFPEAKLVIKSMDGNKATADITIRDKTETISFDVKTEALDDKIVATAVFNIDRIKHNVMHGWTIENAMLSNEFKMEVKIVATK